MPRSMLVSTFQTEFQTRKNSERRDFYCHVNLKENTVLSSCVKMCSCVHACVRACVRAHVRNCVRELANKHQGHAILC
jgi:hypothetical protein